MKRTLHRGALAALGLIAVTNTADAVPIHIDFSGTTYPGSSEAGLGVADGDPISGGFTLETDDLVYNGLHGSTRSWVVTQPASPLAYLRLGSRDLQFPSGSGTTIGILQFTDDCTPASCSVGADNFSFYVATDEPKDAGFTGIAHSWSFYFASLAITRPPGASSVDYFDYFDYFDGMQVEPLSLVTLPLHDTFGSYFEDTLSCAEGFCESTGGKSLGFNIDSVTRGVGARAVPEPGTLGMMAFALTGMLLVRRRVIAR
jgi:hypothetical protein